MKPSIVAPSLKKTVLTYLTSSFGLVEDATAAALADFFSDPVDGLFRGPFMRVRAPFRPASEGWQRHLDWYPPGFIPHLHQAKAWERLSSRNGHAPEPTVVATGTGSGKTESFLVPVLDHCARHAAEPGVKVVIVYPMNALATDQAARLDAMLADNKELQGVTAGLYVGEQSAKSYRRLLTERADMRQSPPNLLLTNYKMLDLLLTRADDAPLWANGNLAYLVVDEFHTFNGAQGTDVAMLLRRLKAASATDPTPVATSATLGDDEQAREVASSIFGRDFPRGSVIGEDRLSANEYVKPSREVFPEPSVSDIAGLEDPYEHPEAISALCEAVLGSADLTPAEAGEKLRGHKLLAAVLDGFGSNELAGKLITADDFYGNLSPWVMDPWKQAWNSTAGHDDAVIALERLLALISWARMGKRPLLHVETHFWIRSVSRLLRTVPISEEAPVQFAWSTSLPESGGYLPAITCRHCGRSGWMVKVKQPQRDQLKLNPAEIYTQSQVDKKQTRALIAAYPREEEHFDPRARIEDNPPLKLLDGATLVDYAPGVTGTAVLVDLDSDASARAERCPACGNENAIRFIGAGLATLSSVVLTEVFQHAVDPASGDQAKALLFNDSVQDAAHRAGFLSARAANFSLRTHLAAVLKGLDDPDLAETMAAALVGMAENPQALGGVIPDDLHPDPGVAKLLSGDDQGSGDTWRFIGRRLALSLMLEFGLRSYAGRTLERTGVVATTVDLPDPVLPLLRDVLRRSGARLSLVPVEDADLAWHARGVLDRLQMRGGIWHDWLREWIKNEGAKRWSLWGGRQYGMPAFPDGVSAPTFMLDGTRAKSQFDRIETAGETWLTDWTRRVLHLNTAEARKYLRELLKLLADQGVISRIGTGGGTVYALTAGRVNLTLLSKEEAESSQVGCDVCSSQRTVLPSERERWRGTPCPRWRCGGTMREAAWHDEYYYDRYTAGDVLRLQAAEHTGILSREQRERVEEQFKNASTWDAPNVLTATSTLELGIDIGDLSTVALAGIPPAPASYVQRSGRAGRTTGNALTIAFADRRPRDLAYFTDPGLMINGDIRPPGARLEATAILRRQYTAFLVDKAARGALADVKPLPHLAGQVFGPGGWLGGFNDAALSGAPAYSGEFCDLFGSRISEAVAEDLRQWAGAAIERDIKATTETWESGLARLRGRLDQLADARKDLEAAPETRPEKQRDLRVLAAEQKAVRARKSDLEHSTAHAALTEGGLLPNYALIDSSVTLEATLTFVRQDSPDAPKEYVTELRDYARPATSAITEFAPGNHVYFRGYAHEVKGIDLGGKDTSTIELWNICPSCASVAKGLAATERLRCPHCGFDVSDAGNRRKVAVPTTVYAYDRAADIRIDDREDSRDRRLYNTVTTAEVTVPAQSWRSTGGNFGFDYTPAAVVRRINLGPVPKTETPGDKVPFAGQDRALNPFWVCTDCGGTKTDTDPTGKGEPTWNPEADPEKRHHRHWCSNRDNNKEKQHESVLLAHELDTEVLRFLLPMRDTEDAETILSFQAALAAGINTYFQGDTSHLDTETCTMADVPQPGTDAPPAARVFTVLYDQLRSGTGYLKQLSDPDAMRKVLQAALKFCTACECESACHRCLLSYARERHYDSISRAAAAALLERLLDNWTMEQNSGIGDISLNEKADSRLEKRFNRALHELAHEDSTFTMEKAAKYERILTFAPLGAPVTRWRMRVQIREDAADTVPDCTFTRVDGPPETVALYLDGFDYHAQPAFNRKRRSEGKIPRTSDDAAKRGQLIEAGKRVFAATWLDVERLQGSGAYAPLVSYAAQTYAAKGLGLPVEKLKEEIAHNPLSFLFDYLAHPDADEQRTMARAACVAVLADNQTRIEQIDPESMEAAVAALAQGEEPEPGTGGMAVVGESPYFRIAVGFSGMDPRTARVSAQVRFDDDPDVDGASIDAYRESWRLWLRWANALQFLSPEDGFTLRATGMPVTQVPREPGASGSIDVSFRGSPLLDDIEGVGMHDYAAALLADGAAMPEIGDEHVGGIPAELAWPDKLVAVFPDPVGRLDSSAAVIEYRNAGWHAAAMSEWDREELLSLLTGDRSASTEENPA
ncbi:DEAD/DEAH box helicase [Glycomyces dulcitolivorans]|uniref:DEAD/DEAH box helicase n=1 Tax=Glycomyces dulcitolivorans TaxID=2200759 RepID=UPI000DD4154F|nr:DEAD/DEAH box helicase [Glycomyces dulcitolivorans]